MPIGDTGQVLSVTAVSKLPAWLAAAGGGGAAPVTQVFTASGTYTPTADMVSCLAFVVGGGGGSGGTTSNGDAGSGGGGGGGCAIELLSAADIGASQAVTIGAGGSGGTSSNQGGTGGTSSLGALLSATGGVGSLTGNGGSTTKLGGVGGAGTGGDLNLTGEAGEPPYHYDGVSGSEIISGRGGSSFFGTGGEGRALAVSGSAVGQPGNLYGGGAGGSLTDSATDRAGGAGAAGVVYIVEFF